MFLIAIASLGLPIGSPMYEQTVRDMHEHPVLTIIQMVVFQLVMFVVLPAVLTWLEKRRARRAAT